MPREKHWSPLDVITFVVTLIPVNIELKVRKVGNSLGVVLPKEAVTLLNVNEGGTLLLTDAPGGGMRLSRADAEFTKTMAVFESLSERYRNTLRELAK